MTTDDTDPPVPPSDEIELEITEGEYLPSLGSVVPAHFRERLALALKTTDSDVLSAAEAAYRGTFRSSGDYLAMVLSEHIPQFLHWLLDCIDYRQALALYENDKVVVWTIALSKNRVMVFESPRGGGQVEYSVLCGNVVVQVSGEIEP